MRHGARREVADAGSDTPTQHAGIGHKRAVLLVGGGPPAHNVGVSTVTRPGRGADRWTQVRRWADPAYLALCLADAVRWLGRWLIKALVGWGAIFCGDPRLAAGWRAQLRAPRTLRHELLVRREVARGIAQLEDHLAGGRRPQSRPRSRSRDATDDRTAP